MERSPAPRMNCFGGLSRALDRKSEHRNDGQWISARLHDPRARYLVIDAHGDALVEASRPALRTLDDAERTRILDHLAPSLLGELDGCPWFLLALGRDDAAAVLAAVPGARMDSLRAAAPALGASESALFAYAKGLAHWQRETRHCPCCGAPLRLVAAGFRAECTNRDCARFQFPRVDPAVIMLVEQGDACLLGRQAGWPPGRWSTLAGFVEPGEALEDAVRREVAEESGVIVDDVRYHSSQPWPLPQSLMVGFTATASSRAIAQRDHELEGARWFTVRDIASGIADGSFVPSTPISISHHLLADWMRRQGGVELRSLAAGTAPAR